MGLGGWIEEKEEKKSEFFVFGEKKKKKNHRKKKENKKNLSPLFSSPLLRTWLESLESTLCMSLCMNPMSW